MAAADPALARLAALASALESVALAATSARAEALADCEAPLEAALGSLPAAAELSACIPSDVAAQLRRIQLALQRCRRVGQALSEVITASLAAQGVAPAYAPAGMGTQAPRLGRLEVRV